MFMKIIHIQSVNISEDILKQKHNSQISNLPRSVNIMPLAIWFYAGVDSYGKTYSIFFLAQQITPNSFSHLVRFIFTVTVIEKIEFFKDPNISSSIYPC